MKNKRKTIGLVNNWAVHLRKWSLFIIDADVLKWALSGSPEGVKIGTNFLGKLGDLYQVGF